MSQEDIDELREANRLAEICTVDEYQRDEEATTCPGWRGGGKNDKGSGCTKWREQKAAQRAKMTEASRVAARERDRQAKTKRRREMDDSEKLQVRERDRASKAIKWSQLSTRSTRWSRVSKEQRDALREGNRSSKKGCRSCLLYTSPSPRD